MKGLLHELFEYKYGNLIRKVKTCNRVKVGDVVGSLKIDGYTYVSVNSKQHLCHRLIWVYHNGDIPEGLQIDHINGIRDDNKIDNLRLVTNQENAFNNHIVKGYSWEKDRGKYRASIMLNNKKKTLGFFDNKDSARMAYLNAKKNFHQIEVR